MEQSFCLLFITALVPGEEGRLRLRKSYGFIKGDTLLVLEVILSKFVEGYRLDLYI